ncbi:MAG: phenylalanine--tRNA ligase beta subunit-related protein [Prevotella sp.]|nr:phenylalanine--tRNA ligase beta subunit-related protein [Bacteroides sp.]MCM1366364.1 phenylalanine--tRNA ligase beta subunit-related protein [Prevotella sp.]MCM1436278.1 phenylalanine--tRNA ligase beta subunit-related protein [Prevotella sp.]
MNLTILPEFSDRIDQYRVLVITANVTNSETSELQKAEMKQLATEITSKYEIGDINKIPAIAATRSAYKRCGKDPNRYRPSQEQLMRRIVRGLGLYNVNAIVDTGNQFSLLTGCSIGCFDADKIKGDSITLGVGHADEPYEGIGRGPLNIEGLPVFRDATGGIGTPTSDNERTKISLSTTHLIVTIHIFDQYADKSKILDTFTDLFSRYCNAEITETIEAKVNFPEI